MLLHRLMISATVSLTIFMADAQTTGSLKLNTLAPQTGKPIQYTYSGKYAAKEGTKVALFYFTKGNFYATDVSSKAASGKIAGSFTVPDSTAVFALRFLNGEDIDDNDAQGFIFPLYKNGKIKKDADKELAGYYDGGIAGYFLKIKTDGPKALALYKKAALADPAWKKTSYLSYLRYLTLAEPKSKTTQALLLKTFRDSLQAKAKESSLSSIAAFYGMTPNGKPVSDSLMKIVSHTYTKGDLAIIAPLRQLVVSKNTDSVAEALPGLKTKYPEATGFDKPNSTVNYYYASILGKLATAAMAKGETEKALSYINQISNKSTQASKLNEIAWPIAEKGENLDFAEKLSKQSLDDLDEALTDPLSKPTYYTPSEWKANIDNNKAMFGDTYAFILFQNGKKQEALAVQQNAVELNHGSEPEINERYMQFLNGNEKYAEAIEKGSAFVIKGKSTEKLKGYLKEAYEKTYPDKNATDYIAELDKKAKEEKLSEIKKTMIHDPSSAFTLKDLAGNTVSLADYKGKVVILDFWATWCGPCKMSFPGMQLAVDKYKEDKDVAFLFIDTWENQKPDDRLKEVSKFIEDNKYSFHVLLDEPKPENKNQFAVVDSYGITGIPTKFVLDKNGEIRFKVVGFNGSSEGIRDEVSAMIELAKEAAL